MMPDECPDCYGRAGLCFACQRAILPQLRVNVAWLKLIGEALVEQKRRQSLGDDGVAVEKAKRREGRKRARQSQHATFAQALIAA